MCDSPPEAGLHKAGSARLHPLANDLEKASIAPEVRISYQKSAQKQGSVLHGRAVDGQPSQHGSSSRQHKQDQGCGL